MTLNDRLDLTLQLGDPALVRRLSKKLSEYEATEAAKARAAQSRLYADATRRARRVAEMTGEPFDVVRRRAIHHVFVELRRLQNA